MIDTNQSDQHHWVALTRRLLPDIEATRRAAGFCSSNPTDEMDGFRMCWPVPPKTTS
ncbi:MAG: hypothetical protein KGZ70_10590 [Hydrogenophaga sp.]|uniref:hypothetical protein n=1 Tax=Hydrogenophaga sp. TaxID=1904254 RepID=UPI001BB8155D|nr:hypothetical protein [Hydrogenophaga sp.]MBS3912249.1 hypothetical protein [Hydrogenophaga sp.]MDO9146499.1 hypothetical protein [Hydrogenophaga sp.]MDO9605039.1 hypothetical protein [Hydrogenophaga sp.]MDP2165532.1 hypothetical protein [Hydrogenophaga sp.]MDP3474637.1 hypothetical protein [Hydrogenophaga sp.]